MTSPIILRAAVASLPESAVRTLVDALIARETASVKAELETVLASVGAVDPVKPATIVDRDGDKWTLRPNGFYAIEDEDDDEADRDLNYVRDKYGPIKTLAGAVIPA